MTSFFAGMAATPSIRQDKISFYCEGLCGSPECNCEFSQEIDFYLHTNKDDPDSVAVSESKFCKRCMRLFLLGETADDHNCKPLYQLDRLSSNVVDFRNTSCDSSAFESLESDFENSTRNIPAKSQQIVGLFWDIENIFIPDHKSPAGVVRVLREMFVKDKKEVDFQCVCDTHKEERFTIDQLNSSLVTVVHVTCTNKNAADEKLKQLLVKFSQTYQAPGTVVLLSGDVNFSSTLNTLKNFHKFHVVLVHNRQCSQALKETASELHLIDDLIIDVPPPRKRSFIHSSFVIVSGLPVGLVNAKQMRNELAKLCDNTGGRIVNIEGDDALIRFQQPENAARCQRRLNNLFLLGVKITARLTNDKPIFNVAPPNVFVMQNRFSQPLLNTSPSVISHSSNQLKLDSNQRSPSQLQTIKGMFNYWLKFYPRIHTSSFEVITPKHIDVFLTTLRDIFIVDITLPLIDSIAVYVHTSLQAELLIKNINQRKLDIKKIQLYTASIETLYFHNFIADAYIVLSHSKTGWMFMRDFFKEYYLLKQHNCPKIYIDRLLSTNNRIVCGFLDEDSYDFSILANEDCNPLLNYSLPSDLSEFEFRLKVNELFELHQFNGKMHFFDLLPTFRSIYGIDYFKMNPGGANVMSILSKLPDISILHESKTGVCRNFLRVVRSRPTGEEMKKFNIQIVKYLLVEKSHSIPFKFLYDLCNTHFHLKLSLSPNGIQKYDIILTAIGGMISQLTVAPKIFCRFSESLQYFKQQVWELISNSGEPEMTSELVESAYYEKTGQAIPTDLCYITESADLLSCIPGLKIFPKQGKLLVTFIVSYLLELQASQSVCLVNSVLSQQFSMTEFCSQYYKVYGNPIKFSLDTIPQICIQSRDNAVSRIHLSLRYLAIEICHFLYQQPNNSTPLVDFSTGYLSYYNKPLSPNVFGFQTVVELLKRLEDYIIFEYDNVCLLSHRIFACEVCQVFRKLTHPNESILLSNFHCSFLKVHYKDLKLSNYNATKLTPLLLKVSDVIEINDTHNEDRLLTLTPLGRFVPEAFIKISSHPRGLFVSDHSEELSANKMKIQSFILNCENLLFTQPNYFCLVSEFAKLYWINYNKHVSLSENSSTTLTKFFTSNSKFFKVIGSGTTCSVSLQPERVFVGECRLLLLTYKNGINVSNLSKEFSNIFDGKQFDISRYGSYSKLTKLIYDIRDAISLIGPNASWMVSNETCSDLIEADKQVDILYLSNIIHSSLIDMCGECLAFDEIPYIYQRLHRCDPPKWMSVLVQCSPLLKMYTEELVSMDTGLQKIVKDKRVYFKLSSTKWEELFKFNAICLFYRKNKLILKIKEFVDSYQVDYCNIDLALLGYQKIHDLFNSHYLQVVQNIEGNFVRLSSDGLQLLFQMQLVEILYNSENNTIMVDSITSKYYNTYGYNLKLKEMNISKLHQLLSFEDIASLVSISGDKKEKRLSLKSTIIQRERCRQVLTELSIEFKFPFDFKSFAERYYTKFKEKCDIHLVYNSASQVIRVLGHDGCFQITSGIFSYPHRNSSLIFRDKIQQLSEYSINDENSIPCSIKSTLDSQFNQFSSWDTETISEKSVPFPHKNSTVISSTPQKVGSITSVRILKRPKKTDEDEMFNNTTKATLFCKKDDSDTENNHNDLATSQKMLNYLSCKGEILVVNSKYVGIFQEESSAASLSLTDEEIKDTDVFDNTPQNESKKKNLNFTSIGYGRCEDKEVSRKVSLAANFSLLDVDK